MGLPEVIDLNKISFANQNKDFNTTHKINTHINKTNYMDMMNEINIPDPYISNYGTKFTPFQTNLNSTKIDNDENKSFIHWDYMRSPNSVNFQNYLFQSPIKKNNIFKDIDNDKGGDTFVEREKEKEREREEVIKESVLRADYKAKYAKLKENFPSFDIGLPKDDWSIKQIIDTYETYEKNISLHASVEHNQMYLVILWIVIYLIGTRWLGLPLDGYIKFQNIMAKKYQYLLFKLMQDKTITAISSGWSIPMQIIWLSFTSCILFILCKYSVIYLGKDKGNIVTKELQDFFDELVDPRKSIDTNDKLKQASEATSENTDPSIPNFKKPGSDGYIGKLMNLFSDQKGGQMGNILGMMTSLYQMFNNGGNNNNNNREEEEEQQQPKKKVAKGFVRRKNEAKNE